MAKIYKFTNYAKTFNVSVITDGYADQKSFHIVDILGKTAAAIQAGFKLDIQPITEFQLEALATNKNFTLSVEEEVWNTAKNKEAEIKAFQFNSVTEADISINEVAGTIKVNVPNGTTVTALVATFLLSTGATAKIGATAQVSGTTANNFTTPKTYTITSEFGNTKDYVVTVVVN